MLSKCQFQIFSVTYSTGEPKSSNALKTPLNPSQGAIYDQTNRTPSVEQTRVDYRRGGCCSCPHLGSRSYQLSCIHTS